VTAPSTNASPRPRLPALDAARALGVVAMVFGHCFDALLDPVARAQPAAVAYWKARGLTAPLFMLVAGWAVTVAVRRGRARGLTAVGERLPRVILLFVVGVALRFPGWDLAGLEAGAAGPWSHLLAFDALHVIAVGLLIVTTLLSMERPQREERLWLVLLMVTAVSLGLLGPAPLTAPLPSALPALAVRQAFGGTSPFPLVPWTGYFFAGALLGLLVGDGSRRAGLFMLGAGLALVALTAWQGVGTAPPGEPALVAFRIGVILVLLAALGAVPRAVASRLAPLGRLSLPVYALHVPLVYGWSTFPGLSWRIGPTLGFGEAALVATGVLAASVLVARVGRTARLSLSGLLAAGREAV
jgi:acyltransferase